jgi:A/G-specific adenine glycosylase
MLNDRFQGEVPSDAEQLKGLTGVGNYIANAVLCFAYNRRAAVVDTNVIRVLARVFGLISKRSRPRTDPELWRAAAALLPRQRVKDYNWALLDLGKKLCTPRNPKCSACPLAPLCDYYRLVASSTLD